MKKVMFAALFGMIALTGFSQVRWDAQFGINFSNMTKEDDYKALPGFTLGVGMDYAFTDIWSLKSGLMFSSKGWKYKEHGKSTYRPVYMEIPVMAALKMPLTDGIKFVVNAGPYFAVGLGGKTKTHGSEDVKIFGSDGMDMKRFDLGVQYGVGVELAGRYLVNLTGQNGFISPFRHTGGHDGEKSRNMSFAISLGYIF